MPTPTKSLERAGKEAREGVFRRFVSGLSFPKLFFLLTGLFLLDAFFPDPIPFIDEAILGTLAVVLGSFRQRRQAKRSGTTE
jgi:hypothetical protein